MIEERANFNSPGSYRTQGVNQRYDHLIIIYVSPDDLIRQSPQEATNEERPSTDLYTNDGNTSIGLNLKEGVEHQAHYARYERAGLLGARNNEKFISEITKINYPSLIVML